MFSRFFIERPIFASVISIVLLIAGIVSVLSLPSAQYPEITPPTVEVKASYPGANAQVVAETVAAPIEQQVNGVENSLYMSSTSAGDGSYTLTVTFEVGTDLDMAQVMVQNRVALATPNLPEEVNRQGVNTKMLQIATQTFSIDPKQVKLESTNTTRVANTSPSAASATADLNGKALQKACNVLLERLTTCAADHLNVSCTDVILKDGMVYTNGNKTKLTWDQLVMIAFLKRICLTENGHYATPTINFDMNKEKGHPFAYHVYGLALAQVTLDCIRGTYEFDAVKIVHDFGKTMNPDVDFGQVEGGLIQGMGWMTMEEIHYNDEGQLMSNTLSTYKIPDIYSVPKTVTIEPLDTEGTDMAILKSKAVGEPPLMYGIGAYFAIDNAIKSFNPNFTSTFDAPFTHEKVLMGLHGSLDFE